MSFLEWLLPARYTPSRRCENCGESKHKSRMIRREFGWFCNEDCYGEFWRDWQI